MSIQAVRSVVESFLRDPDPQVMSIKGSWGVGKTYAWNKLVEDNETLITPAHYCYISLFGLRSIRDINAAIVATRRGLNNAHKKQDSEAAAKLKTLGQGIADIWHKFGRENPLLERFTFSADSILQFFMSPTVICFDDLERSAVNGEELLGLVSELKERQKCKVVLIFNEDKLPDNGNAYSRYREKVVDIELAFKPTVQESIDLAFGRNWKHYDLISRLATKLRIRNIRVLKKMKANFDMIYAEIADLHQDVIKESAHTATLFTWCMFSTGESAPTKDFVLSYADYRSRPDEAGNKELEAWVEILKEYNFGAVSTLDLSIVEVISAGHVFGSDLRENASLRSLQFLDSDHNKSVSSARDELMSQFHTDPTTFVANFVAALKKASDYVKPLDVDGTCDLLRAIGFEKEADEVIEFFVQRRQGDVNFFDLNNTVLPALFRDERLISAFTEAYLLLSGKLSPQQAIATCIEDGFTKKHLAGLQGADETFFYELFMTTKGPAFRTLLSGIMIIDRFGFAHELNAAKTALKRIRGESGINALHLSKLDLEPVRERGPVPADRVS